MGHLAQVGAHAEGAARAGPALHRQLAAHQLGQQVGDGQAQAGARTGPAAAGGAALEGQEDALQVGRGDADAGVHHLEAGDLAAPGHAQAHLALVGELHRIGQQVDEDLAQALGVGGDHGRQPPLHLEVEGQALGPGLHADELHDLREEVGEGHLGLFELELAGLDAGQVQQAVDQLQQVLAAAADHVDRLAPARRQLGVALEDLGVAEDAVERRAQLVRHAGHVAGLGGVGGLGLLLGGLQLGVGGAVGLDLAHQQRGLAV